MTDTKKNLIQSALKFFSGTMLSRITGLLRDISMAYAFGADSFVAALLVAFRLANLLRRLLGEGAMQNAFIPHFETLKKENPFRAGEFFCRLTGSLSLALVVLILAVMGALSAMLSLNFFNQGNAQIAWLTLLMMPSLLFICLFGINASFLQCNKSYFTPGVAPALFNLVWILGVICTKHFGSEAAMTYLAVFIVIGFIVQWAATLPKVFSQLAEWGVRKRMIFQLSDDVKMLIKPLGLGIIGVAASQINNALDALFARFADPSGPALLWYAIRLQQLPLALFGITLSGVLLPPLSRAIKTNDEAQYLYFLNFAFSKTLLLMIPMTLLLFVLGDKCVALIFGHGDFSDASIAGTTLSLWGYAAGLLPMALILVLAPAYYAKGDYHTPTKAATSAMIINILLNTIFAVYLGLGAFSIALATSISAWLNFFWLIACFKPLPILSWSKQAGLLVLFSIAASISVIAIDQFLWNDLHLFAIINGEVPNYSVSWLKLFIHLCADSLVFIAIISTYVKFSLEQKQNEFA